MGRTDEVRLSLAGESGQCEGQEGKMGDRVEQSGPRAVTRHLVTEAWKIVQIKGWLQDSVVESAF